MENRFAEIFSYTPAGLYCKSGNFYIDARKPVHHCVVSHAHSDHAIANCGNVYATRPTCLFMNERLKGASRSRFHQVVFGQPFTIGDATITLLPSGHMLGSAQVLIECDGLSVLYSGDYKLQQDDSCDLLSIVKADILITETTFADPQYQHPDPAQEILRLNEINDRPILIGAYSIGKAQRLTKLISQHLPEKQIFIYNPICRFHHIYEREGFPLGNWSPYRREEVKDNGNAIFIVPPAWLKRNLRNKNVYRVFATGWKHRFHYCDMVLQISDHVDWNGIIQYIEDTKASVVYTVHGKGKKLQEYMAGQIPVHILN